MITQSPQPPWEFLLSASRNSLQSFELSRLAHVADIRKEMQALINQWIEQNSEAMLARWLLEQRDRAARAPAALSPEKLRAKPSHSVSDNIFADGTVAQVPNGGRI